MDVRPVSKEQWPVLGWLWQCFRHDLSEFVDSYPRADGRFNHTRLDRERGAAYLAWHDPRQGNGEAPVGFSLVTRGEQGQWHMMAFFVVRRVRRTGMGRQLALETIGRHPGPWEIAFQDANRGAGRFWRRVADEAFPGGWSEERRTVPGKPALPPDVWICARG